LQSSTLSGQVSTLQTNLAALTTKEAADYDDHTAALDTLWILVCGFLVMLMQAGFAMVEAGTCRVKNVSNILLKNCVDVCIGTLCWYAFGWTLAYGFDDDNANDTFAGNAQYFGHEFLESDDNGNQVATDKPRDWFFQWAFCATGATIVSGGVAERVQFPGYLIFTICMTTVIYPVVVAWMWSGHGWLQPSMSSKGSHLNDVGFNDFAGSGIVHMTGGVAALVGAIAVGARKGRFDASVNPDDFAAHNLPLIVLGTFILWFGWYGFNCGSTLGLGSAGAGRLAAVVAMNTTIAAAMGGLVVLILRTLIYGKYDVGGMCNGILGGLVSITAGCGNVESGSALVIGIIGGLVFQGASMAVKAAKVDDPIDAFAVHGACGIWGVLAACIFDWGKGFDKYNGFSGGFSNAADANGNTDNLWKSGFAAAIVEILCIFAWSGGLSLIIFVPLRLAGILRAADDLQDAGMDARKHSPSKAYFVDSDKTEKQEVAKTPELDCI
jgi:Amt family ammonium transporter